MLAYLWYETILCLENIVFNTKRKMAKFDYKKHIYLEMHLQLEQLPCKCEPQVTIADRYKSYCDTRSGLANCKRTDRIWHG